MRALAIASLAFGLLAFTPETKAQTAIGVNDLSFIGLVCFDNEASALAIGNAFAEGGQQGLIVSGALAAETRTCTITRSFQIEANVQTQIFRTWLHNDQSLVLTRSLFMTRKGTLVDIFSFAIGHGA